MNSHFTLLRFLTAMGIFLFTYGTAHAYLLFKLARAFPAARHLRMWAFLWIAPMMLAPFAIHAWENILPDFLLSSLSRIAFFWMGFLFLFCSMALVLDAAAVLITLTRMIAIHRVVPLVPSHRITASLSLILSVLLSFYALWEAAWIRVDRTTLPHPAVKRPVRLLHLSDLHVGAVMKGSRLQRLVRLANEQHADLILLTGDLLDGRAAIRPENERTLAQLTAAVGKFAAMGNHEWYSGMEEAVAFHERAGFRVLRNAGADAGDSVHVVGVDDPGFGIAQQARGDAEPLLLSSAPAGRFVILLKHRPTVSPGSLGRFHLQLSGHTHGGQVFPFNVFVRMTFPQPVGLSQPGPGSFLHLSRGAGVWGPPMRLFTPPHIAVIDILPGAPSP